MTWLKLSLKKINLENQGTKISSGLKWVYRLFVKEEIEFIIELQIKTTRNTRKSCIRNSQKGFRPTKANHLPKQLTSTSHSTSILFTNITIFTLLHRWILRKYNHQLPNFPWTSIIRQLNKQESVTFQIWSTPRYCSQTLTILSTLYLTM